NSAASGSASDASSSAAATKTVVDAYGRSVEVPKDAKTAATVGSGARFVVYAGAQDKLIAVTEMETTPAMNRPYAIAYKDLFANLPSTSNGNHLLETNVNKEQLMDLNPDVIISSRSAEECDALQKDTGIPVIGITYQNQLFTDNVYNSITCVGEALGTEDHANEVVAKLKEWDADLKARTADIADADKPSVYVGAVNYKGAKSFTGTYANYAPLVELNAKNVADETGQKAAVDVDLEQIGNWDPDYMFLNAGNMDLMKADYANNQAFFDGLKAFRQGNLYTQPFFNFNGTNIDTGICDTYFIGATIYPDKFADVDLKAKYSEIYTALLGVDFYQAMQQNGMDFKSMSFN
ncbi:ABC transporter substrate-binding protein, partial [uncultured Senegalimassilia sp.]|uniref:ABC transporter substrate-binding protein n=1 Tax=uncultured Senegalimassilia sp. TaxID=1714350 RepID=UPI0026329A83